MLRLRNDIPLFPNGRQKALTFSFDDGVSQDIRFIKLLDKYNLKGTFNISSGLLGDRDWLVQSGLEVSHCKTSKIELKNIYRNHEVAAHSLTHVNLANMPSGTIAYEITKDRDTLEGLVGYPICGMAYPFGTYNDKVKKAADSCGIEYARTIESTGAFTLPEDFLVWHPTCHYRDVINGELVDDFLEELSLKEYHFPMLFYVWGHTYEFDGYGEWEEIERFMKKICHHKHVWYATNIEIYEYIKSFDNLKYSASGDFIYNPNRLDLWMCIDCRIYKLPSGEIVQID